MAPDFHTITLRCRDYFRADRLPLRVKWHTDHSNNVPHDHEFMEVALVVEGSGAHYTARGQSRLRVGDAFLFRPGAWHVYHNSRRLAVLNCIFEVELLRHELATVMNDAELRHLLWSGPLSLESQGMVSLHLSGESRARCRQHMECIERLGIENPPHASVEQAAVLSLLLVELARALGPEFAAAKSRKAVPSEAVRHSIEMMKSRPSHNWTIEEMSRACHLNRHYFMRVFKSETGLSPMAYLARHRAERAAMLLLDTQLPVNEVATDVGWSDPNYFARRFKEHFGLSASDYRARFARLQKEKES